MEDSKREEKEKSITPKKQNNDRPVSLSSDEDAPAPVAPPKKAAPKRKLMNTEPKEKPKKRPAKTTSQDSDSDVVASKVGDKLTSCILYV